MNKYFKRLNPVVDWFFLYMKVFFLASASNFNKYEDNYKKIANIITKLGHEHTCDFILSFDETFFKPPKTKCPDHYKKTIDQLLRANVAIFEVTVSSLAIG